MKGDLEITRDIVTAMAPDFGGDGRLVTVALRKVSRALKKYDSADAKKITRDIMVAMAPSFEGNVNRAVEAMDRILTSMQVRKKKRGGRGARTDELDVQVVDE